jgi:hypothetical protein
MHLAEDDRDRIALVSEHFTFAATSRNDSSGRIRRVEAGVSPSLINALYLQLPDGQHGRCCSVFPGRMCAWPIRNIARRAGASLSSALGHPDGDELAGQD